MEYRKNFPIFDNIPNLHYLDTAATSQKPQSILSAVKYFYENANGNSGRGSHDLAILSNTLKEQAREVIKNFINAKSTSEIIFTKNATEALNIIANGYGMEYLQEGDEVILGISNHHANIVPWQVVCKNKKAEIVYVYLTEDGVLDLNDLKSKISSKTKIVSFSGVVNVTGVINPIEEIVSIAHGVGAKVVVDAAQSILHFKHDVDKWDVDFLCFSGHKIFSETGIGVLYGKENLLNEMPPFLYGGDMIEYVEEQTSTYAPLPNKFEAGTQNVAAMVSLDKAVKYMQNIGYDAIKQHEDGLIKYVFQLFKDLEFIETYNFSLEKNVGIMAFNVKGVHSHDVSYILNEYKVMVRSGHHCAQPLMKYLNIPSCCRISLGVYNNFEDIDALFTALKKVKEVFKI